MSGWQRLLNEMMDLDLEGIKKLASYDFKSYQVYPESMHIQSASLLFIAIHEGEKKLVIVEEGLIYQSFIGLESVVNGRKVRLCDLSVDNCKVLHHFFPFTRPQPYNGKPFSIGLGDRLGLASAGQIRLLKNYSVFPVLAQQSMRELKLTGRTYEEVLSAASWAVFQEGYITGYGADGDHLKTKEEVAYALSCGYTIITLDSSDYIDNEIMGLASAELEQRYLTVPQKERLDYETKYLNKAIKIADDLTLCIDAQTLKRSVMIYRSALKYIAEIYREFILPLKQPVTFEISIDETSTPTTAEDHYFVAKELLHAQVKWDNLAPKFVGEFQKGIDYRGNLDTFEKSLKAHVKIAGHFGYRISVHSGSDKFSIFPSVGRETNGSFHLKTAGTHWLEALRVIGMNEPSLFKEICLFALNRVDEARKYYHISADKNKFKIDSLKEQELWKLLDNEDFRQILHITYGLVLSEKNCEESYIFRDRIYDCLNRYEIEYAAALYKHLKRHLDGLGIRPINF